jgi:hypothetical protein
VSPELGERGHDLLSLKGGDGRLRLGTMKHGIGEFRDGPAHLEFDEA